MKRTRSLLRLLLATAAVLTVVVTTLLTGPEARSDDRDLLRFDTAKPYLFIILDTSASMNLDFSGQWLPAGADNPESRLYGSKEALYEVLLPLTDVQFGFATFNQDKTRVRAKHWRYAPTASSTLFPFTYPNGEYWTFGEELAPTPFAPGEAGSCAAPLDVTDPAQRLRLNTFPMIGAPPGDDTTTLWLTDGTSNYRMDVSRNGGNTLGATSVELRLEVSQVTTCSPLVVAPVATELITFDKVREFLMMDDNPATATSPHGDPLGGFWDYGDILSSASCSSGAPFTGKGIEGNYDSGYLTGDGTLDGSVTNVDQFCATGAPNSCYSLMHYWDGTPGKSPNNETILDSTAPGNPAGLGYRALDYGDMIPFHWAISNKDEFLSRLNPNHLSGPPDYGVATFFKDTRDNQTRNLELESPGRRPILAVGDSPIGKAVADFRCWYRGAGVNKCGHLTTYDPGWEAVALDNDSEWGCRRPYLIVISDGDDTCAGENPCADTANLYSQAQIRTWTLVTRPTGTASPPMTCMAQNGRGELIYIETKQQLKDELIKILGEILEQARSFASAAVPSTEASVQDKIYLSNFVPLNGESYWEGHLVSYLKPLPVDAEGKPDPTHPNFVWDTATAMLDQIDASDPLDYGTENKRRLFYSRVRTDAGTWWEHRRLFDPTVTTDPDDVRYDLWRGFELIDPSRTVVGDGSLPSGPPAIPNETDTEARANAIIAETVALKTHDTDGDGIDDTEYIFGDIFHSSPIVLGAPTNGKFYSQDLYGTPGADCDSSNKGYRCFFERHQYRRKVVAVGANDGMFHLLDGGIFNGSRGGAAANTFDNGTGKEVLAYIPRAELPDVRRRAGGADHYYGVDGTIFVSDVFIDPKHDGTPDPDEREWRTLAIGAMREGGSSYFALDLTQPDKITQQTITITLFGQSETREVWLPDNDFIPSCIGNDANTVAAACGPVPYGAPLWEFTDSIWDSAAQQYVRLDEDGNGQPDLALTWSSATSGRIRMDDGSGNTTDKFVAVFGGGMTTASKNNPTARNTGDWVFMVDVETGETIYKWPVVGAVPGDIAAVDSSNDGYLDRLYFGTLAGYIYRADLVDDGSGTYPALQTVNVTASNGVTHSVERIVDTDWQPRIVFNASVGAARPRPIYFAPSVIWVPDLGEYALSFGTGDREDLWANGTDEGRFYVFVDDGSSVPFDETVLQEIDPADSNTSAGENYLTSPSTGNRGGWYLRLDPNERVITKSFALSGVTFFTSYTPDIVITGGTGNTDPLCTKTGESRIFVTFTTNGDSILKNEFGDDSRFLAVGSFVTPPYAENRSTTNPTDNSPPEELTADQQEVLDRIKELFPPNCRFTNNLIDIKAGTAETNVIYIAPIPQCMLIKNWKEF